MDEIIRFFFFFYGNEGRSPKKKSYTGINLGIVIPRSSANRKFLISIGQAV
jgi:hypothetical protein